MVQILLMNYYHPGGYWEDAQFPTGEQCTNYVAEVEVAHIISTWEKNCSMTDTLFASPSFWKQQAWQTFRTYYQCRLRYVTYNGSLLTVAYQEMKMLAVLGAAKEQKDNWVTNKEMKSRIKSFYRPPKPANDYYLVSHQGQVNIFWLRTGWTTTCIRGSDWYLLPVPHDSVVKQNRWPNMSSKTA